MTPPNVPPKTVVIIGPPLPGATYLVPSPDSPDVLPSPDVLMGFEQIEKGLGASIVKEAIKESEHRRSLERMLVEETLASSRGRTVQVLVGQIGAIFSVGATAFVAVWFAHAGSPYLGWAIFGGTLLSVVYAFLAVTRSNPNESVDTATIDPGTSAERTIVRPVDKTIERHKGDPP